MSDLRTVLDDIDALKASLTKLDECEAEAVKFAAVHAVRPLRFAMNADGLTPTRRKEAKGAYELLCAALGLEAVA